ncbi:MAG: methyl-accepting chemotaxis protein, partial [Rickettsiales bacterium]|nr:methyl-accepting chemotaxis protein [Rickettsiales bacterium]
ANFYGASATLSRIKPLMEDYDAKNKALLAVLDKVHAPDATMTQADLAKAFNDSRESLMALFKASQEEMNVLLNTRIASFQAHLKELLLQGGTALLIGFVLFWLISRSIANPINRLRKVMMSLAKGDIDVEVPYTRKRDEIGQMANAVVVFKDNAVHLRKLAKEFEDSVKHVVEIVASAATEMDSASRDLTTRAETSHAKLKELNIDVGNVLQSIQHVSTAGDQLTSAITEISSQVHKSTATTSSAVQDASNVKKVAEAMAESAQKVSGIVGIINGIAAKITLLALNATIEAARAGEAGKGFAVVASEVKTLATQTATATAEISNLVGAMQGSSQETLTAISQITSVIDQINQISSIIAAAIEEQGAATKEISGHINQASKRVDNITKNVAEVTESAGHSTAAATQTLQASNELAKQSEHLRSEVTSFLGNLAKAG